MSAYDPPKPWIKEEGGFKRRLFGVEAGYAMICEIPSSRGHSSLSMQLTVSSATPTSNANFAVALRRAWLDVRFNLAPSIGVSTSVGADRLDPNSCFIHYRVVDAVGAKAWAEETVIKHAPATSDGLAAASKPAATLVSSKYSAHLRWAPDIVDVGKTFHLLFDAGHWLCDGRGSFRILRRILDSLNGTTLEDAADYAWGTEIVRLSIPLSIAMGLRSSDDEGCLTPPKAEALEAFKAAAAAGQAAISPAFSGPISTTGNTDLPVGTFPDATATLSFPSSDLLAVTRAHGLTVTPLMNVIVCLAFVSRFQNEAFAKAKTVQLPFISTDRREHLPEELQDRVGVATMFTPLALDARLVEKCLEGFQDAAQAAPESLWELAKAARVQLITAKHLDTAVEFDHEFTSLVLPPTLEKDGLDMNLSGFAFMTSVGKVSIIIPTPAVGARWTASDPRNGFVAKWSRLTCHLWEWGGKTTFRVVASRQYHEEEEVRRFVKEVERILGIVLRSG